MKEKQGIMLCQQLQPTSNYSCLLTICLLIGDLHTETFKCFWASRCGSRLIWILSGLPNPDCIYRVNRRCRFASVLCCLWSGLVWSRSMWILSGLRNPDRVYKVNLQIQICICAVLPLIWACLIKINVDPKWTPKSRLCLHGKSQIWICICAVACCICRCNTKAVALLLCI